MKRRCMWGGTALSQTASPIAVTMMTVVVMMAVPVVMLMAVTLVFGVVTAVITSSGHKHLEVLWTVGMVMVLAEGPVIQQRVSGE
mgnify:CR=1 FL=1